jgi:tRNA nucleotidyltransferase/poly(A) polymerase
MKSFAVYLREALQEKEFSSNWKKAFAGSEELRVALNLMKDINKKFPDKEIYIVGGVPRDILMGYDVDDVDMATNAPFEELAKHYKLANISKNDSQPVYAIKHDGYVFDLAKFREDAQSEGGRKNNQATEVDDFETDTKRRDITINSFGIDAEGNIVDYQNGLEDLRNKIIRAVGDAKARFNEDATRILRTFRFAAKMGFDIEENTLNAAIELKHLLHKRDFISLESISKEFYKAAYNGKTLARFLKKLDDAGILDEHLPEFTSMKPLTHDPAHHPEGDSMVLGHIYECLNVSPYKDPVINLAVMFHDFGKAVTRGVKDNGHSSYHGHEGAGVPIVSSIFNRLRFAEISAQDKKKILDAVELHMMVHNLDKLNIKTLTRLINSESWEVIKAVGYCDEASRGSGLFDEDAFWEKINSAETKVHALGDKDKLRKQIASYINGNMVMNWFPEVRENPSVLRNILPKLSEYVLELIQRNEEPQEDDLKMMVQEML